MQLRGGGDATGLPILALVNHHIKCTQVLHCPQKKLIAPKVPTTKTLESRLPPFFLRGLFVVLLQLPTFPTSQNLAGKM